MYECVCVCVCKEYIPKLMYINIIMFNEGCADQEFLRQIMVTKCRPINFVYPLV